MTVPRMHVDEVEVSDEQVHRLLADQAPEFAHLPLRRIDAWGTDHVVYRLGDELSVRLPKIGWADGQGEREAQWLPSVVDALPVAVPIPVVLGEAGHGYPMRWYVAPWIVGTNPDPETHDLIRLAGEVAAVMVALRSVSVESARRVADGRRGAPLHFADAPTQAAAERLRADGELADQVEVDALLAVWNEGVAAPAWDREPVWVHGDLSDGNVLVCDGALVGVIDWNGLAAGDPAVELMCAWNTFDAPSRGVLREAVGGVDDATWIRGRAWAASAVLQALPYYRGTNPDITRRSLRAAHQLLTDP